MGGAKETDLRSFDQPSEPENFPFSRYPPRRVDTVNYGSIRLASKCHHALSGGRFPEAPERERRSTQGEVGLQKCVEVSGDRKSPLSSHARARRVAGFKASPLSDDAGAVALRSLVLQ